MYLVTLTTLESGEGGSGDEMMKKIIRFQRTMTKKVVTVLRKK